MASAILTNATEGLPAGFSSEKTERVNSKSKFMTTDGNEAAEILSEIGPAGSGAAEGNPDAVAFKHEALKTMLAMSQDAAARAHNASEIEASLSQEATKKDLDHFFGTVAHPPPSLRPSDPQYCLRDYNVPCPRGFMLVGDQCWPTADYAGKCNTIHKGLLEATEDQKMGWERKCDTYWPCLPSKCPKGENWYKNCPVSWYDNGEGECENSQPSLEGICPNKFTYRGLTVEAKQDKAKECSLRWPCLPEECQRDYSVQCPEGWTATSPIVCKAAEDYLGPCPRYAQLGRFNHELKVNFEIVCFTFWPCRLDCVRDYTTPCPLGWTKLKGDICAAPADYPGPLAAHFNFNSIPVSQREAIAQKFNVDYPCIEREHCDRDYSSTCPIGWAVSSDGTGCSAPSYLSTSCSGVIQFNRPEFTDAMKADLARKCQAEYPCKGEYHVRLIKS